MLSDRQIAGLRTRNHPRRFRSEPLLNLEGSLRRPRSLPQLRTGRPLFDGQGWFDLEM
jgi:hypothetical protein